MEQEQELLDDVDLEAEDGEISASSDEVYTPLQRPAALTASITAAASTADSPLANVQQMQAALDEDDDEDDKSPVDSSSDSSGASTDAALKKLAAVGGGVTDSAKKRRKRVRRTVMVRVQPTSTTTAAAAADAGETANTQQNRAARFKKYNIWTAALQEDAITENMRGCDVTRRGASDRSVENYDYSLRYRLNGENSLKRRLSNSTSEHSDSEHAAPKRRRPSTGMDSEGGGGGGGAQRRSVKSRLGHRAPAARGRRCGGGSSPTSDSEDTASSYKPRHILDLEQAVGRTPVDVAREIANKLYEEKDELLVRIVEVLGIELPIEVYKETQRIEADGGMMIQNRKRRRTPGGVFLFLLKHHDRLTSQDKKTIFIEERQSTNKRQKHMKSRSRDRKVEELKKRLSQQEKELPALSTGRKELLLLGSDLSLEHQTANLSNPPPSPVGHEHSPEYKAHAINHVVPHVAAVKASSSSAAALDCSQAKAAAAPDTDTNVAAYDEEVDFLDLNYNPADMDFF